MKKEAISMLYESVKHRVSCDIDTFEKALKEWEIVPLMQEDKVIGAVMLKENEIHVGYGMKPLGSIKKHIQQTLNTIIKNYGYAVTYVDKTNQKGIKFCKRLGFIIGHEVGDKISMRCDRSNYV